MDRQDVIEVIGSDMLGYQEEILDIIDRGEADIRREDIIEQKAKLRALRRIARKLGIRESVEAILREDVA